MIRPFDAIRLLVISVTLVAATACAAWQSPLGAIGPAGIQSPEVREDRAVLADTIESDMLGSEEEGEVRKLRETLDKILRAGEPVNKGVAADTSLPSPTTVSSGELAYVPNSTKKVYQLTGDFDRTLGIPTLNQTRRRFGIVATDLGSSFEHKGKLYFLFGDSWGRRGALDAVAWTESADPENILLDFHRERDGKWRPPVAPGISQGGFEVPSGGISIADIMYVVFTTDHSAEKMMGRSVLASSEDDGRTFRVLYEMSRDKFINASLWSADGWLYIYGSGEYRKSSVYLARVKPEDIGDRSKLEYFAGAGLEGLPQWSPREVDAVPLFPHYVVGEFSVARLEAANQYVMLYNSGAPRGIMMRSAQTPWGPWSEGVIIWETWRDNGYGHFMHISAKFQGRSDTFSDPRRVNEWGGEYGPYIMARFTSGSGGSFRIYFTMSTWNPYQVIVMRSDLSLGVNGEIAAPEAYGVD